MQGWLFHESFWTNANIEAYLRGVPDDAMIILDLNTEATPVWSYTNSYFGKVRTAFHRFRLEQVPVHSELPQDSFLPLSSSLALDLELAAQLRWQPRTLRQLDRDWISAPH